MILWSIFLIVKLGAELMPHPVDESIRDRKPIHSGVESSLNNLSKDESLKNTNDYYNSNDFSSGTFEQASAPPFPFPPQSAGLNSTSSPRYVPESSLSTEEQLAQMISSWRD